MPGVAQGTTWALPLTVKRRNVLQTLAEEEVMSEALLRHASGSFIPSGAHP